MKCINNCGFFASEHGYCSKCYKLQLVDAHTQEEQVQEIKEQEVQVKKNDSTRCFMCNKKLGTNIVYCKCEHAFCSAHIFYKNHGCMFDFKTNGKKIIQDNNPKLHSSSGLQKI